MKEYKLKPLRKSGEILWFIFACIVALMLYFVVYYMKHRVINAWDEAIYANNSVEMFKNGNYTTYTLNDTINNYNSKPPLVLYAQVASYHLFGISEFSLRLPTFLALFGVILILFLFSIYHLKDFRIGLVSIILVLTNEATIRQHVFLTGDLDGVLAYFSTLLMLVALAIPEGKIATKHLFILTLILLGGYFVKSTSILLLIPSLIFILFLNNNLRRALVNKYTYIYMLFFIACVFFYYEYRGYYDSEHWNVVFMSEFQRYVKNIMPWNSHPYYFYIQELFTVQFALYAFTSLALALLVLFINKTFNKQVKLLFGSIILYLVVVSIPEVKMGYYLSMIIPLYCIGIASLYFQILDKIQLIWSKFLIVLASIIIVGVSTYFTINNSILNDLSSNYELEIPAKFINKLGKESNSLKVLYEVPEFKYNFHDVSHFYRKKEMLMKNKNVQIKSYIKELNPRDTVIVCQGHKLDSIQKVYNAKRIDSIGFAYLIYLDSIR